MQRRNAVADKTIGIVAVKMSPAILSPMAIVAAIEETIARLTATLGTIATSGAAMLEIIALTSTAAVAIADNPTL